VLVSPPTNREILATGAKVVADVTCLPVKVYAGHFAWLRDHGGVDAVFVPAIRSVEKGALHCSKFQGLPDLIQATISDCPPILDLEIDVHRYKISPEEAFRRLGLKLTRSRSAIRAAWKRACLVDQAYCASLVQDKLTYPQALERLYGSDWGTATEALSPVSATTIAVVGHPYCLFDEYINHDLLAHLRRLGVRVLTSEMVSESDARQGIQHTTGQKRWFYENWMSGAAGHYFQDPSVAGIIAVQAFTCGPDSAMVETMTRRAHALKRPFMSLVLDEHGSAAGMITRLEAFVDMLSRPRTPQPSQLARMASPRAANRPVNTAQAGEKIAPPVVLKELNQPRLGFPSMGTSAIALKSLFSGIGAHVELGPALSSRTVSLGVRYSPEFICTPYKYILGNMIEMLEAGADTLLYMDGAELCRNSTYTQLLNDVLHDLGYKFKLVSTAVFEKGGVFALPQFLRQFMQNYSWPVVLRQISLALAKMNLLDELERRVQQVRPREVIQGCVDKIWQAGMVQVDEANDPDRLKQARLDVHARINQVEVDPQRKPVKIATTGEYYAVLEPFFNLDVERVLGQLGAEVQRTLMLGDWVKFAMIFEALGFKRSEIDRAAKPYLRWNIGGEGLVTVGQSVIHAKKGFDGIVELLPFTCIPEITVLNILPRLRRDLDIPIIPFILDEQSGRAGMKTRLEAFVDLLYRRREARNAEAVV
jgi:predicted nucleotide-binding protein (sugar kinase/HSP70/actin superfamily)